MPRTLQAEASSRSGRIDLAETLQFSAVVIALHLLKRMHKSIQIGLRQLTVLLPCMERGSGANAGGAQSDQAKLGLITGEKYSENCR